MISNIEKINDYANNNFKKVIYEGVNMFNKPMIKGVTVNGTPTVIFENKDNLVEVREVVHKGKQIFFNSYYL